MTGPPQPSGVYPMLFAPFDASDRLERAGLALQIEAMVAHGVHGIAVLGLASEGNKLASDERRQLVDWTAELIASRKPFCATILEASAQGQIDAVRAATALGAGWVILQPPPARGISEMALVRFFGQVADKAEIPVAIQVAPEYLGVGMSAAGLATLHRNHPNVSLLKVETGAIEVARLRDATDGAFAIFTGRAGLGFVDAVKAGAAGVIPGAESFDFLTRIFDMMKGRSPGRETGAVELYQRVLPVLVFLMDSIDNFLVYGKQVLRRRLPGFPLGVRPPFTPPTAFGETVARSHGDSLGPLR